MNNIETLVHVEIEDRLSKMNGLDATTEECKATADLTLKLVDRYAKMAEIENQAKINSLKEKELNLQAEANTLKAKELEEAKKHRWSDFATQCIKVGVPAVVSLVGAVALTNYERSEVTTGTAVKDFWRKTFKLN